MKTNSQNLNEQILRIQEIMGAPKKDLIIEAAAPIIPNLKFYNFLSLPNINTMLPNLPGTNLSNAVASFKTLLNDAYQLKGTRYGTIDEAINNSEFWQRLDELQKSAGFGKKTYYPELIDNLNLIERGLAEFYRNSDSFTKQIIAGQLSPEFNTISNALTKIEDNLDEVITNKRAPLTKAEELSIQQQIDGLKGQLSGMDVFIRESFDDSLTRIESKLKKDGVVKIDLNVRSKLEDIRNKAAKTPDDFWQKSTDELIQQNGELKMSKLEFIRYWKYTRFVNDLLTIIKKNSEFFKLTETARIQKTQEFFKSLENDLPVLFDSVVKQWRNNLGKSTENFVNLSDFEEFFRKIGTQMDIFETGTSNFSEKNIEYLINIFKENPRFKELPPDTQQLMVNQLDAELKRITPGEAPGWLKDVVGPTVVGKIAKNLFSKNFFKEIGNIITRYTLSFFTGLFKTRSELKSFFNEYNTMFLEKIAFKTEKVTGLADNQIRLSRWSIMTFMSKVIFPFFWGATKAVVLPLLQALDFKGWIPQNPAYDDASGLESWGVLYDEIVKSINAEFTAAWASVTQFGEKSDEVDSVSDICLTGIKLLIPLPTGSWMNAITQIGNYIGYFQSPDYETDLKVFEQKVKEYMEKYKDATLEQLEVMKKELEEKGEQGTAEYRAIMLRIDLLKNSNTGEGGNQQGGNQNGGVTPPVDPNPAPVIPGLEQEMRTAFEGWRQQGNSDSQWDSFSNNTGHVMVKGNKVQIKRLNNGTIALMLPTPVKIN